ncbi:MAG TPA: acyltransferase family protein [Sulfurovum sp.]|nr:acyltransferase family protein [Sulfurovum sp.]
MLNKKFIFLNLTTENTLFYKGVAIIMIIMHNYFHLLPPIIGENEQDFNYTRLVTFIESIFNKPEFIFQVTFSFFGHYGVQVFIFLSAYGLTKKYINSKIHYVVFLKKRILKIYPAFMFSIILWAIYTGLNDPINVIINNWESLLYKLLFIANFIPGELYSINGPWWFVSLIVQFYIIFPFVRDFYHKYGNLGLLVLSFASLLLTAHFQPKIGIPLPGTILTHIPEISIGIFLAQQKKFSIKYSTILIIFIIFILSNYYQFFWYLSYSSALFLLLILFQNTLLICNQTFTKYLLFIGSISMYIFYINGFMRTPWIEFSKQYDLWYLNILFCVVFIMIVIITSFLMYLFSKKIRVMIGQI